MDWLTLLIPDEIMIWVLIIAAVIVLLGVLLGLISFLWGVLTRGARPPGPHQPDGGFSR